jgi:hypothetical protein
MWAEMFQADALSGNTTRARSTRATVSFIIAEGYLSLVCSSSGRRRRYDIDGETGTLPLFTMLELLLMALKRDRVMLMNGRE